MGNIYALLFVEPWPFWLGGVIIGLVVPLLYYYYNTALGVSTGYGNLVKITIRPNHLKWIKSKFAETWSWRVYFIIGIILGGFISSLLQGSSLFTWQMGQLTPQVIWSYPFTAVYLFVGGILLGLGARIAGGCTSGHSIHGIANLHFSSIIATLLFLLGGIISANLARIIFLGGGM